MAAHADRPAWQKFRLDFVKFDFPNRERLPGAISDDFLSESSNVLGREGEREGERKREREREKLACASLVRGGLWGSLGEVVFFAFFRFDR